MRENCPRMKSDSEATADAVAVNRFLDPRYINLKCESLTNELRDKCVLIKWTAVNSFAPDGSSRQKRFAV
jgi:hypothetical protein